MGEIQTRKFEIETRKADKQSMSVPVVLSTEFPVERRDYTEVLDHSPESVDLSRAPLPVIEGHDSSRVNIGLVDNLLVQASKLRGTLILGKTQRAKEVFDDIQAGIIRFVSLGYEILSFIEEEGDTVRVTKFRPLELSLVAVPADPESGLYRSHQAKNRGNLIMNTETQTRSETRNETRAVTQERERVSRINAIAAKFGDNTMLHGYIERGLPVDDYIVALGDKRIEDAEKPETVLRSSANLDLSATETRNFSLMNACRAAISGDWKDAEFERECSLEISKRLGREPRGFFVPMDIQTREMATNNTALGGSFVGTDHLSGMQIDNLRANSIVMTAGATTLPGLVGDVEIPKLTSDPVFAWIGEGDDGTQVDLSTGSITMSPRTVAGAVGLTRRMMKQSSPAIEGVIQNAMARAAANAIDLAVLEGTGAAGQPLGITNVTSVLTSTIAAAGSPTWVELVEFETDLAGANALNGSLAYVTTPTVLGNLKTTAKDAGSGLFLFENGLANGYQVFTSSQLSTNRIIFGNFADVLIGMWGILDLIPDAATNSASGGVVLRVFQDMDVAVQHAESFSINA